jgi:hypothetical protein
MMVMHVLILAVLGMGGFGVSLGVPPLPETPTLAKIAPEQCLFYFASAGTATPDAKSPNQTEQLLAEPEVQKLSAAIETAIKTSLSKSLGPNGPLPGMSGDELADFIKLILAKPLAVYVAGVEMCPTGPAPRIGVAIKFDDDVDKVKAKLADLTKLLPPPMLGTVKIGGEDWQTIQPVPPGTPAPPVTIVWGFQKKYLLLAVGEGEMEALIARAKGQPPAWLVQLRKDVPIERLSIVGYLNVKTIRETYGPMAGPQAAVAFDAIGLNNINSLVSAAGLDQTGYVAKTLISLDGEPQGLLQFSTIKPLSAADLASVPADASMAVAIKINPLAVFDAWIDMVGKVDPRAKEQIARDIGQAEAQLGLKLRDDLLKPLGDSLSVYSSMGGGGLPEAGVVLQIKDSPTAAKTFAKLMQLAEAVLQATAANNPSAPKLTKDSSSGKDIYTLQISQPGIPPISWCLTEKELVVSTALKAYLSRPADFKSLSESPAIAKTLSDDAASIALVYWDVKGSFEKLYPMIPMLAMIAQQQGINLNLPAMPPADTIAKHLSPLVATVHRAPAGIEIAQRMPLPGLAVAASAPVLVALLLPAVQSARGAARSASSTNNLKQIALAIHNYHDAKRSLPPACKADKDGKPLLSWRVLILPFLEENELYKQFHLDEPWDSENNKPLIARIPDVYKSPNSKVSGEGKTNYLTVRGPHSMFPGDKALAFKDVPDGLSHTIMTVEANDDKAVIWTKPDDFQYDEEKPLDGLGGMQPGAFLVGFGDGSVRRLPSTIDPKTLNALFTRDGGEPINMESIESPAAVVPPPKTVPARVVIPAIGVAPAVVPSQAVPPAAPAAPAPPKRP